MTLPPSSSLSSSSSAVTFADLLRSHRTAAGLTQEELADKAHLSVDAISALERGERRRPRKDTIALLADALELAPDDRATFIAAARRTPNAPSEDIQVNGSVTPVVHPVPTRPINLWQMARPHLVAVALLTLALLTVAGVFVPLVVPTFPRALGWIAGLAVLVLLAVVALAPPLRHTLRTTWRVTRHANNVLVSVLLCLVVVITTLFTIRPTAPLAQAQRAGYDFSYSYHRPTHLGGSITIGTIEQFETLSPNGIGGGITWLNLSPIWQGCLVQLPDQRLGLKGWKADQCTEVPTVDNGGESADERTTTFHIDPRAVWSDGVPITADDFLFGQRLVTDPNLNGGWPSPPMSLTTPDAHTVRIQWEKPNFDYLSTLSSLYPSPLHVYGVGKFAGIFDPATGAYNSRLAQQLSRSPEFMSTIPVDDGPFTVQSFVPDHQLVLVKNPRFFSNFFHTPALDKITVMTVAQDFLPQFAAGLHPLPQMEDDLINRYRQGALDLAAPSEPFILRQLGDIPKGQAQIASAADTIELAFNQRQEAPNAKSNGGVSIFTDRRVRQAFIEAFDRCAAVQALLGNVACDDPNIFTDESDAMAAVAGYDPTFKLPVYNPSDAARLLDSAGYRVVDGVRRDRDGVTPLALDLLVSPGASASLSLAEQMQQDFARYLRVGVTIDDKQIAFWKKASPIQTGVFDLMMDDSENSIDPINRLTNDKGTFDKDAIYKGNNPFGIIDPQMNQRDQLAAQTPSDEQRAVILLNLHRDFSRQYYFEPLYIHASIALKKPTLCNFKLWPDSWSFLWNIADWYVAQGTQGCP
ncbi:MAG TPA: ABC transporter substrate-binding protein [Ktedonobacterales bacterium]|nr:ABC transporter substrate-binding protein [Ktedonobacterales bacterium]